MPENDCIYNYLTIIDGKPEKGLSLEKLCGSNKPPTKITSSSNQMALILKTDAGSQKVAFKAQYSTGKLLRQN